MWKTADGGKEMRKKRERTRGGLDLEKQSETA